MKQDRISSQSQPRTEPSAPVGEAEPSAICVVPNCGRSAPANEAFCSKHRGPPAPAPERIRSYIGNLTGEADDPFYQAVLALWGDGFDYAHGLRACGHSIGDWRDPNYDPEKPDQPLECCCIGCEREAGLLAALTKIARLRTELSGDFSMASKQSDIARAAIAKLDGEGAPLSARDTTERLDQPWDDQ